MQLLEAQTIFNPAPSRIVGQAVLQQQGVLTATAPNLVEGREFNNPQAVAVDASANPSILYVADFGNNRVLAWKNASAFTKGDFADKVIGQRDLLSTAAEGPGADLSTGLSSPVAWRWMQWAIFMSPMRATTGSCGIRRRLRKLAIAHRGSGHRPTGS